MVVIIGPIEFSAKRDNKIATETITVNASAAYAKAAIYLHRISSLVICMICDTSPDTRNINISPDPNMIKLNPSDKIAIHSNSIIV